ncbi:helix-turn-helix domain-containing protein [Streptomyces sp. ISL-10]|nr:helix-turn-helix domain-containing protein [Streptomyces sp. ISL-10]
MFGRRIVRSLAGHRTTRMEFHLVARWRPRRHPVQQHQSDEHTIADLAELFSVSRATVYRVLERH